MMMKRKDDDDDEEDVDDVGDDGGGGDDDEYDGNDIPTERRDRCQSICQLVWGQKYQEMSHSVWLHKQGRLTNVTQR